MRKPPAQYLAWSFWAFSIGLGAVILLVENVLVSSVGVYTLAERAAHVVGMFSLITLGAIIASRTPENPIGWLVLSFAVISGPAEALFDYYQYAVIVNPGLLPAGAIAGLIANALYILAYPLLLFVVLLFPHGELLSPRWQWVAWGAVVAHGTLVVVLFLSPEVEAAFPIPVTNPLAIAGAGPIADTAGTMAEFAVAVLWLATGVSIILRFTRSRGDERQQMKWFSYTASIFALALVALGIFDMIGYKLPRPWEDIVFVAFFLLLILGMAVAILKYRLYDVDLVINRTLVYVLLTGLLGGIYVLVVGLLGARFQGQGNLAISIMATGLVALLFQPLRQRLQQGVNRWLYGQRDDPYAVLTRLGQRLEGTQPPESALSTIVETVAETLKIPYVAIALMWDKRQTIVTSQGQPTPDTLTLPLTYQGEEVGQLLLAPRGPGEAFSRSDWSLLTALAREAGVVAYSVQITEDLKDTRERLVLSREEERRRLRRDLHDGLGPILGSITLKLDSARNKLAHEPESAEALLDEIKSQTRDALAEIRRLAYALRPPVLDQLGLVPSLREYAMGAWQTTTNSDSPISSGLRVSVDAPDLFPELPAAVEVAAYRIVVEAVTNVVRHAQASNCVVRLSQAEDGELVVEVSDDGIGLAKDAPIGVGIASMRERAAELGGDCLVDTVPGGGTRVKARIPTKGLGALERNQEGEARKNGEEPWKSMSAS